MARHVEQLSELHGLVIEYLEKLFLATEHSSEAYREHSSRARHKLFTRMIKELGKFALEVPTGRLAEFYLECRQSDEAGGAPESSPTLKEGSPVGDAPDRSQNLKVSQSCPNESLGGESKDRDLPSLSPVDSNASRAATPLGSGSAPSHDERLKALVAEMQGLGTSLEEIHENISPSDVIQAIVPMGCDVSPAPPTHLPRFSIVPFSGVTRHRKPVDLSASGKATLSCFEVTTEDSMRCSLEWVMKHWNPVRGNSCCPFHSHIRIAKACFHSMVKEACIPLWSPLTGWQCVGCLCLNHEESRSCDLCLESRWGADQEVA